MSLFNNYLLYFSTGTSHLNRLDWIGQIRLPDIPKSIVPHQIIIHYQIIIHHQIIIHYQTVIFF